MMIFASETKFHAYVNGFVGISNNSTQKCKRCNLYEPIKIFYLTLVIGDVVMIR